MTEANLAKVTAHKSPLLVVMSMEILDTANLLEGEPDLCDEVFRHEKPDDAAKALVELIQNQLNTSENRSVVFKYTEPSIAVLIIASLDLYGILTDENRNKVLEHEGPDRIVTLFRCLGENLCTQDNLYKIINHPDIDLLASDIEHLEKRGKLDQNSFNSCLVRTGWKKPVLLQTPEVDPIM